MRRRAAQATPPVEKLPFLEGLRGLAALYVVLSHFCSMADPSKLAGKPSQAPQWLQIAIAPFGYGHLAVAAFIVISGFCLQISLYANGTGRIVSLKGYFRRRSRRILPPYYACLGLSLVVCVLITEGYEGKMPFDQYLPVTWENILAHLLLVQNLSLDWMYKINGVLWSIAIEVQLYFVFPILVKMIRGVGRPGTLLITALVSWAAVSVLPNASKLYPWYLALFTAGMVSASFAYRPSLRKGTAGWLAILIGWPSLYGCFWACSSGQQLAVRDAFLGLGISSLIYAWAIQPKLWIAKKLSSRYLVGLGAFSYSLYLMHHPIEQVVYAFRPWFVQGEGPVLLYLLVVGLPVILFLTYVFSQLFEQPFISRRRAPRETAAPVPLAPASLPLKVYGAKKS